MSPLIHAVGRLGKLVMNNKGKVLMGVAAMALAPALRWAMERYLDLKSGGEEGLGAEAGPRPPRPRPNKREIYKAPKVPTENLVRH